MTRATPTITRGVGAASWSVDPAAGGRLTSLRVAGQELIAQRGDVPLPPEAMAYGYGAFPMIPWAGRIRAGLLEADGRSYQLPTRGEVHAMHGTTYDHPWQVAAEDEGGVLLRTGLGPDWPFSGEAAMAWRSAEEGLRLRLSVLAHERMPVWIGVHPWFRRTLEDGRVVAYTFDAQQMYVRGPDGLPTGATVPVPPGPWDDCFAGVSAARLRWDDLELTITATTDIWVVYDERPEALCFEPQTGPPDALRLGQATWLDAGQEHVLEVHVRWRQGLA
jgi:aldose 1-epimerase